MTTLERFARANEQSVGKIVARIVRQLPAAVSVEFTDGTGLYIDTDGDWIEVAVCEIELQKAPDEDNARPPFRMFE